MQFMKMKREKRQDKKKGKWLVWEDYWSLSLTFSFLPYSISLYLILKISLINLTLRNQWAFRGNSIEDGIFCFQNFNTTPWSFSVHWHLCKPRFAARTGRQCSLSPICSRFFLVNRLRLRLSAQRVHVNALFSHLPRQQGRPRARFPSGRLSRPFCKTSVSLPTFPLLPLCHLYSSHLEYRCEAWRRSSHLVTMGITAFRWEWWGRKKVWGLRWPALVYKPLDFLLYKMKKSLLF